MPKVSVLTPIYKTNPDHLRECIDSILGQTFSDFEFLILNDSPDETYLDDIVKSYSDKRIKYIKNKKNLGISASRNRLLNLARGEYIAIFDHDDISMPTRLEKQVEFMDENPDVGVCGAQTLWFPKKQLQNYPTDNISIKRKLINECAVPHSAAMIRRCVMVDNGIGWESEFSPSEDYMLWVRLINKTMFANLPDVLLKYRMFNDNTTNRQRAKMIDRTASICNIAYAENPYLRMVDCDYCVKLFFFIPLLRIKRGRNNTVRYYLFKYIPLFTISKIFN